MNRPSNFLKEYIKKNSTFQLTDEELNKLTDVAVSLHRGDHDFLPEISEEKIAVRKYTCLNCEHLKVTDENETYCNLCGCDVNKKIRNATDHCPIEKWDVDREAIQRSLQSVVNQMNERQNGDWYAMMSHEDFEELLSKAYQEAQKNE